uniref:Uncharacterized protein n=1 Tax=Oryctolagus cuniculus TaxID=9986 RepID=A0A5F9DVJ4_RABIT
IIKRFYILRQGQFKGYEVWATMKTCGTKCSFVQSSILSIFQIRGATLIWTPMT